MDTSPLSNYVMHPFWNQTVKVLQILLYLLIEEKNFMKFMSFSKRISF